LCGYVERAGRGHGPKRIHRSEEKRGNMVGPLKAGFSRAGGVENIIELSEPMGRTSEEVAGL
jgi:hypothetical protein